MLPIPGIGINSDATIKRLFFLILVEIGCLCMHGVSYSGLSKKQLLIKQYLIFIFTSCHFHFEQTH